MRQKGDDILDFLKSIDPPQKDLYPILIEAGLKDKRYLRAMAQNTGAMDKLIAKLESYKKLNSVQAILIQDALTRFLE